MGGEYDERIYKGKHTKEEIEELFLSDVREAILDYGRRGYTGTIAEHSGSTIVWASKVVATEERCRDVIEELQTSKWDDVVGVFYKSVEGKGCVVGGWCSA